MQGLVCASSCQLVNSPAVTQLRSSGRAIEIAIAGLDGRMFGKSVAGHIGEIMQIGEYSSWSQPVNDAEIGRDSHFGRCHRNFRHCPASAPSHKQPNR